MLQNKWFSSTLNNWNGKDLVIDEANGAILSTAISAGKKNTDNTFTGVVVGDWSANSLDSEASITKHTGVYGFNHGVMAYSLTDDGTATFGAGEGRIYIDGTEASMYSMGYKNQNFPSGMKIDLDEPKISLKNGNNEILLNAMADSDEYPFIISDNFKVNWQG